MNIQEAKQEIKNALRTYFRRDETGRYVFPAACQRPLLLMGPPGIGKTAAQHTGSGSKKYTLINQKHLPEKILKIPLTFRQERRLYSCKQTQGAVRKSIPFQTRLPPTGARRRPWR